MNADVQKSIGFLLDTILPNDAYDACIDVEKIAKFFSFGYDYDTKQVYVSSNAFDFIQRNKHRNYYTTSEGFKSLETILGYEFTCEIFKGSIPLFEKIEDEFIKLFEAEICILKNDNIKSGDNIIGQFCINPSGRELDINTTKIRQNLHDAKNQLMSMATLAGRIGDMSNDKTITDYTYNIKDAVYNCNYLIDEACGKNQPKYNKQIDIHKILSYYLSVIDMENNITVEQDLKADNEYVFGNCIAISNAVQNIMLNAVQAMEHNGRIRVRTRNQVKKTLLYPDGIEGVTIAISDNGSGIDKSIMKNIFDNSFTTKDFGSGLGLYTTKQTVSAHRGTIQVRSKLGKGTTFTIFLPNE